MQSGQRQAGGAKGGWDLRLPGKPVCSVWPGGFQRCPWCRCRRGCCWLPDRLPCSCSCCHRRHRCQPRPRCWSYHERWPQWTLAKSFPVCQNSSLRCSGCIAAAQSTSRSFCSKGGVVGWGRRRRVGWERWGMLRCRNCCIKLVTVLTLSFLTFILPLSAVAVCQLSVVPHFCVREWYLFSLAGCNSVS